MLPNLAHGGPLAGIGYERMFQEILGVLGNVGPGRKNQIVLFDFSILLLDIRVLKWSLPKEQNVHHNTETPHINALTVAIPLLRFQHLRSQIIRRPTNGFPPLTLLLQLNRKSKITQFDIHINVNEEIPKFKISVDNEVLVKVHQCLADLVTIVFSFNFSNCFSPADHLAESLVFAQVEQNVHILRVLEKFLKTHDVLVLQRIMNFDLVQKFALVTLSRKVVLGNDFSSRSNVRTSCRERPTLGKPTLAQKGSLKVVFFSDDITIFVINLLNDARTRSI